MFKDNPHHPPTGRNEFEGLKVFMDKKKASASAMEDFITDAMRTASHDIPAITSRFSTQRDVFLLHAAMGAVTESAELLDVMKKRLFYGREVDIPNMREEAGDILWYLAILFHEMGWSFEQVAEVVINKLRARYPEKFSNDLALNRDLVAERAVLEVNLEPCPDSESTLP